MFARFGQRTPAGADLLADDPMLLYYLTTLEVRANAIGNSQSDTARVQPILDEAKARLSAFAALIETRPKLAWCELYRIDRLLALAQPTDGLLSATERLLDEAQEEHVPSTPRMRKAYEYCLKSYVDTTQSPPVLKPEGEVPVRDLYLETIEQIQWAEKKVCSTKYSKSGDLQDCVCCGYIISIISCPISYYVYIRLLR